MKKANKTALVLPLFLFCLLCLGGIALFFFPAPRYSPLENRFLAEPPTFSAEDVTSGHFAAQTELYFTERFPLRYKLRQLYAAEELALGKKEVGGVILCRDGSLCKKIALDTPFFQKNINTVSNLAQKAEALQKPCALLFAPCRIHARTEVLPSFFDEAAAQKDALKRLAQALPQATVLPDAKSDAFWFRTDHHWNAYGAHYAYTRLGDMLGFTPYPLDAFSAQTASTSFCGTSYAAAGIPFVKGDSICLLRHAADRELSVTRDGKPTPYRGVYDFSQSNSYDVFLGGNAGVTTISAGEEDTRPVLLVVKDSFANSVLPFLALHYRIVAIDPRYTRADLTPYLEGADAVLCLFGLQTLAEGSVFRH